jgi:hypothetical protein
LLYIGAIIIEITEISSEEKENIEWDASHRQTPFGKPAWSITKLGHIAE